MSSNRPNLASAFAPSAPRGAKLEGILAPKRRKAPDPPEIPDRSLESTRISVVPELAPESEAESTAPSSEFMSTDPVGAIEGLNRTQEPASKTSQAPTRVNARTSRQVQVPRPPRSFWAPCAMWAYIWPRIS